MSTLPKEEIMNVDNKQTTLISVIPKQGSSPSLKKAKRKGKGNSRRLKIKHQGDYVEANEQSMNGGNNNRDEQKLKDNQRNSQHKVKEVDEETMGQMDRSGLPVPYEFLLARGTPSIRSIFFPWSAFKTITFFLSVLYVIMFIILIGFNYSKTQTDLTWNCSLYQLQNKYFPKLRYGYQIWRVFISAFFHSNYAHFCLDLFAIQIYGYSVERYYGKTKYAITLVFASIFSHFLSAVLQKTSISTTPSAVLFAIIGLKLFFLWQYRNYQNLKNRRLFLYILLALIVGINIIPIFVVNNIDYSTHLGGIIAGLLLGLSFFMAKGQEHTKVEKFLRFGSVILLSIGLLILIILTFANNDDQYQLLSDNIDQKCNSN